VEERRRQPRPRPAPSRGRRWWHRGRILRPEEERWRQRRHRNLRPPHRQHLRSYWRLDWG